MQLQEDKKTNHNKSKSTLLKAIIVVGVFALGVLFGNGTISIGPFNAIRTNKEANLSQFWQVWDLLYKKYDGDINRDDLIVGATSGMVAALNDPYTEYLTADQAKELSDDLNGKLSGIGIEVGIKNNRLTVIAPIDGTPAATAGIRAGDIIASIDGTDSSNMTIDEAVKRIRGDAGTKVKLTVITPGKNAREIEITRQNINVASTKSEVKDGNIGYLRIRRFGDDTSNRVAQAVKDFKNSKTKGIIIDLRDNPGGYLDSSVDVSSEFLEAGKTVVEERSKFKDDKILKAMANGNLTTIPIVVLINNGSASASEIVAGALRDNQRATLVGEKSYGKGSVQEVIKLGNDAELKVTIAHWYTPKGVNISKEGIKPDIEIKNATDDYNIGKDPQLDKALEVIKSKI